MGRFTGLPAFLRDRRLTHAGLTLALVAVLVCTTPLGATAAPVQPRLSPTCDATADSIAGTGTSQQLITVIAATPRSTSASLELYQRVGACWRAVAGPFAAFVGSHGLSSHKHEGDDTTPLGLFAIQSTIYGSNPNPGVRFTYHRLVCGDWWDEDSRSGLYNHFVHLPCGAAPRFAGDSEALWKIRPQYEYFAALAYNRSPVVPGRGSAIFLHVSKGHPTTGCVSVATDELLRVLLALRRGDHPLIDITTPQLLGQ